VGNNNIQIIKEYMTMTVVGSKRFGIMIVALVVTIALSSNAQAFDAEERACYAAVNNKNYDLAVKECSEVIRLMPSGAKNYYYRGFALQQKGEYDRAMSDYGKAIDKKSDYADAYHARGVLWEKKGDYKRAVEDYETALRYDQNRSDSRARLTEARKKVDTGTKSASASGSGGAYSGSGYGSYSPSSPAFVNPGIITTPAPSYGTTPSYGIDMGSGSGSSGSSGLKQVQERRICMRCNGTGYCVCANKYKPLANSQCTFCGGSGLCGGCGGRGFYMATRTR